MGETYNILQITRYYLRYIIHVSRTIYWKSILKGHMLFATLQIKGILFFTIKVIYLCDSSQHTV